MKNTVLLVFLYIKKRTLRTLARRYEFYVLVASTVSHLFAVLTFEILFLPLERKILIFSQPCIILIYLVHASVTVYTQERK